jgi:hypothetical protein
MDVSYLPDVRVVLEGETSFEAIPRCVDRIRIERRRDAQEVVDFVERFAGVVEIRIVRCRDVCIHTRASRVWVQDCPRLKWVFTQGRVVRATRCAALVEVRAPFADEVRAFECRALRQVIGGAPRIGTQPLGE